MVVYRPGVENIEVEACLSCLPAQDVCRLAEATVQDSLPARTSTGQDSLPAYSAYRLVEATVLEGLKYPTAY